MHFDEFVLVYHFQSTEIQLQFLFGMTKLQTIRST